MLYWDQSWETLEFPKENTPADWFYEIMDQCYKIPIGDSPHSHLVYFGSQEKASVEGRMVWHSMGLSH